MIRSFAYVRHYVIRDLAGDVSNPILPPEPGALLGPPDAALDRMTGWEEEMVGRFTGSYLSHSTLHHSSEPDEAGPLVRGWAVEKDLYEVADELEKRVDKFSNPPVRNAAL